MNKRYTKPSLTIETGSAAETEALGRTLGSLLADNMVLALTGDLGAGKTTLTRGIAAGLGLDQRVNSPTFTLINEYRDPHRSRRLLHMDTYRFGGDAPLAQQEAEMIGLPELLDEVESDSSEGIAVLVIEWAERIAALLPADHLEIRLAYAGDAEPDDGTGEYRCISFYAHGPHSAAVVAALSAAHSVYASSN